MVSIAAGADVLDDGRDRLFALAADRRPAAEGSPRTGIDLDAGS